MSSHDARYEDSPAYDDEPGTTATRTDDVVDRDGSDHAVGGEVVDAKDSDEVTDRDDVVADDAADKDGSVNRDGVIDRADAADQDGPFGRDGVDRDSLVDRDGVDRDGVDRDGVDRDGPNDGSVGGPIVLPADAQPEPAIDERPTTGDHAPVTIVDAEPTGDTRSGTLGDPVATGDSVTTDGSQASVGPDTETGALKDPVAGGAFVTSDSGTSDSGSSVGDSTVTAVPATDPSGSASRSDADWRELQGQFVDDPQAAVREAGALVEKALSELRARSESGSTEDLRTTFRRYRDLYAGLT
jgi:hypothetical protein